MILKNVFTIGILLFLLLSFAGLAFRGLSIERLYNVKAFQNNENARKELKPYSVIYNRYFFPALYR